MQSQISKSSKYGYVCPLACFDRSILNCRKLRLGLLLVASLWLCLVLMSHVEAQLNFSTGWGKRGHPTDDDSRYERHPDGSYFRGGQPDREQIMRLYRRLRKIEIQPHSDPQI